MNSFKKILKIIFFITLPTLLYADEIDNKSLINKIFDPISNTFQNLTSFDGIKKAELDIESKDTDFESDIRATIISSLSESDDKKSFWLNQTNISDQDERQTVNIGFIYRNLSEDNRWLSGINLFYDHEFPNNHERASIGVEIKSSPIEINSNFYSRLSGDKTVGSTTERAMDGIDAEIGFQIPYMPNSKLFFQGYEWEGSDYDIDSGNKISLRLRPSSSLQIEIGAEDNSRQSDYKATASVTFTKTFGKVERNSGMYISEELFEFQDMSNEVYDSVRRQNRIVKTVTGTVTVARGT